MTTPDERAELAEEAKRMACAYGSARADDAVEDEPMFFAGKKAAVQRTLVELYQGIDRLAAAPVQATMQPASTSTEDAADLVSKALGRAWILGQTYWQHGEILSQHKRAEETQAKFWALVDETRAALASTPPQVAPAVSAKETEAISQLRHLVNDLTIEVPDPTYVGLTLHKVAPSASLMFSNMVKAVARMLADDAQETGIPAAEPSTPPQAAQPQAVAVPAAEQDRKDAMRYRWLCSNNSVPSDAAIDAAMASQEAPK